MANILEHYKVLGINIGAGLGDVTSSYKRLCRIYHPDVNDNPESEEQMKRINIAYSALRDKLKREMAFRQRQSYPGPGRRHASHGVRAETETEANSALFSYFKAIGECDYTGAYIYLSNHDRRSISLESFINWRKSVSRLYPMREFRIKGGQPAITVSFGDGRSCIGFRFRVMISEEDIADGSVNSGEVEKAVIYENGTWKVFLGYQSVGDLTRGFDERFEARRERDITKRWEEYNSGIYPDYNMLSLTGMRKAVLKELYRQKRFGGTLTFAAISVKTGSVRGAGEDELLRSAARTIVGALRETDIPTYAGDGVFAMLLVELRKKNAEEIVGRLIEKIRKNAGPQLGGKARIEYDIMSWSGQGPADIDALNTVLRKFRKKM